MTDRHDSDPISDGEEFIEILRDQQQGRAAVARRDQLAMDVRHSPDIEPQVG